MSREKNLFLFAKAISEKYDFQPSGKRGRERNHLEWTNNGNDCITIYNDNSLRLDGIDDIGTLVKVFDLTCYIKYNFYTRRIELRVF